MIRQKLFVLDVESLPLDIRRKLEIYAAGYAQGAYGPEAEAMVTELELVVSFDDEVTPDPKWLGDGVIRERVL